MWQDSTLSGLDEALSDLLQAIQNLPEGPKKRQLINQFNRLKSVRQDLSGQPPRSSFRLVLLLGLLVLLIFAAIGINLVFSEKKDPRS
jgi:hypothetical protein